MKPFTWSPRKAESNRRKHGVTFEQASNVFSDPLALSKLDDESSQYEERWITMGQAEGALLLVVHTEKDNDDAIRIISARKATKHERRQYEKGQA